MLLLGKDQRVESGVDVFEPFGSAEEAFARASSCCRSDAFSICVMSANDARAREDVAARVSSSTCSAGLPCLASSSNWSKDCASKGADSAPRCAVLDTRAERPSGRTAGSSIRSRLVGSVDKVRRFHQGGGNKTSMAEKPARAAIHPAVAQPGGRQTGGSPRYPVRRTASHYQTGAPSPRRRHRTRPPLDQQSACP